MLAIAPRPEVFSGAQHAHECALGLLLLSIWWPARCLSCSGPYRPGKRRWGALDASRTAFVHGRQFTNQWCYLDNAWPHRHYLPTVRSNNCHHHCSVKLASSLLKT